MEQTENPRQQLLAELTLIYDKLTAPTKDDFWEDSTEDKIYHLLNDMERVRDGKSPRDKYITAQECPLTTKLLPALRLPGKLSGMEAAVGSEIMQGIEAFLRQQGVQNVRRAPEPGGLNINPISWIDPMNWTRTMAETFAPERLEEVRESLPLILTQAWAALPEDGPALAGCIYKAAEGAITLKQQGMADKEVIDVLFASNSVAN